MSIPGVICVRSVRDADWQGQTLDCVHPRLGAVGRAGEDEVFPAVRPTWTCGGGGYSRVGLARIGRLGIVGYSNLVGSDLGC